jgi:uncharacterized membrane protein
MQSWNSQGVRYGARVAAVLATVATGLLLGWYAAAQGWTLDGAHTEPALMALGLALVVGLRGVVRLDRSLG